MAAMTYGAIQGRLAYLPRLRAEIARQSPLGRGARLTYGFVMLGLSVLLIVLAQQKYSTARSEERMASLESPPALGASGAEFRKAFPLDKLDALRSQDGETLAVVEWGNKSGLSSRTGWINAGLAAFLGLGLMLTAVQAGFDTRRYRNSWKYSIGPTLSTVAVWAAGFILAVFVLLATSNTTWKMSPVEDVHAAAPTREVDELILTWARRNGYRLAVRRYWRLEQVVADADGTHTTPLTIRMIELRPISNWGASWRTGWKPFVQQKPPLNVTQISLDERPEAYIAIQPDWYVAGTAEETQWPATIESFVRAMSVGRTQATDVVE
jgi:hypothetical protein